jgi:hypothetical protein
MSARSQNGWSANDRSCIASYSLPGGKVALRKGDVSVVLLWCANRWHETVEPLVWPGVWGYAERPIRGSSSTLSNHASGTAIDINAPQHPLGTEPRDNFTPLEIAAVRAIVEYCGGTVRWGGTYSGRKDSMHLEINAGPAAVRRIADKIRDHQNRPAVVEQAKKPSLPTSKDTCMIIKTQPDKTKPGTLAALLSGPMFVGLGPTETPSDEQARAAGIPVMWVEYGTWQDLDRRSHNLCDRPAQVAVQNWPAPSTTVNVNRPTEQKTAVPAVSPNSPSSSS